MKIFLFDEPTSGLDYAHMEVVASLLKELAAKRPEPHIWISGHKSTGNLSDVIVIPEYQGKERSAKWGPYP